MGVVELTIGGYALSELLLAMRMSAMNIEKATKMINGRKEKKDAVKIGVQFLKSTYYKSWSRAQLNNTEYAPMLALLVLAIQYKRDKNNQELQIYDKIPMLASLISSYVFLYGVISEISRAKNAIGPSPVRIVGAGGRYLSMGWLIARLAL